MHAALHDETSIDHHVGDVSRRCREDGGFKDAINSEACRPRGIERDCHEIRERADREAAQVIPAEGRRTVRPCGFEQLRRGKVSTADAGIAGYTAQSPRRAPFVGTCGRLRNETANTSPGVGNTG